VKPRDPVVWASMLRSVAGAQAEDLATRVEGGTRVDPYLLASLGVADAPEQDQTQRPDERLWRLLVTDDGNALDVVAEQGRLFDAGAWSAIEVATEAELCGLQALAHAAIGSEPVMDRCLSAARWLMDEIQPDNATNRPWACGFFAWLWCERGAAEALHYVEGQLHAAMAGTGTGTAEPRSGLILLDSANWLDRIAQAG